ncbi:hypothetical protein KC887_00955 [Candidatus Kaiserbacteria bacterium]|nr:hypothetical protein [Candidatus Kaiserbacteria bacterium]
MQGSSQSSSFIPKRNPVKKTRKVVSRRIYTVTIVSYVLLFSTLLAAAGVFAYKLYVTRQLTDEIASLSDEINRFDNSELQRVKDFDARLALAANRVSQNVSVASLFTALESATIGTVSFDKLALVRNGDTDITVDAAIRTDTFDSSMFQRSVFKDNAVVSGVTVENLQKGGLTVDSKNGSLNRSQVADGLNPDIVTFDATISVGLDTIPYNPARFAAPAPTVPEVAPVVETGTTTNTATTSNLTDL